MKKSLISDKIYIDNLYDAIYKINKRSLKGTAKLKTRKAICAFLYVVFIIMFLKYDGYFLLDQDNFKGELSKALSQYFPILNGILILLLFLLPISLYLDIYSVEDIYKKNWSDISFEEKLINHFKINVQEDTVKMILSYLEENKLPLNCKNIQSCFNAHYEEKVNAEILALQKKLMM